MLRRFKAEALNAQAQTCSETGQRDEAIRLYKQAAEADPSWSSPHYNLGLLFKNESDWERSLFHNQQATERDMNDEAAWWNLGIAATALGKWSIARAAWGGFGIDVPDGDGPLDLPCGFCPIRLHPDGNGEIVWAHRLDPARAELASIPFPESGHRWRDVVLNDGAPQGYRQFQGKEVPVFNALQILETSPFGTFVARVTMPSEREVTVKLANMAADLAGSAEDWSTSVRILCKACSEGRPHDTHDTHAAPPDGVHIIAVAAKNRQHATEILSSWEATCDEIRVEYLEDTLPHGDKP